MNSTAANQLDLLSDSPASRATDPDTSATAEREVNRNGSRASQQHRVLEWIKSRPRVTSAELARLAKLDRYTVGRRLPDLESAGLVEKCGKRTCRISGRLAVVWAAIEKNGTGASQGGRQ